MMTMNRFSANIGFLWAADDLPQRITKAAAQGFRAVEMHWPYDHDPATLRHACADAGVELLALNTPLGKTDQTNTGQTNTGQSDFGLAALPGRVAEFRDSFLHAVDFAQKAGCVRLHVMAGMTAPTDAARETFAQNLIWAEAQAPDFTLLLEPLNRFDKPGYFYHLPEAALSLIRSAGLNNTRLMFDAYHVGREGFDPVREYDRCGALIGHVQIAGVPHRQEPDTGQVDFAQFLTHIATRGYAGWVGCEYQPERGEEAGMARLRQLSEALR